MFLVPEKGSETSFLPDVEEKMPSKIFLSHTLTPEFNPDSKENALFWMNGLNPLCIKQSTPRRILLRCSEPVELRKIRKLGFFQELVDYLFSCGSFLTNISLLSFRTLREKKLMEIGLRSLKFRIYSGCLIRHDQSGLEFIIVTMPKQNHGHHLIANCNRCKNSNGPIKF